MVAGYMKIYLRRKGMTLVPLSQNDADELKRLKDEQIIYVDYKKPRNPLFHNKFMAMVRVVFDNQDRYNTIEGVLAIIKVETGHYTSMYYGYDNEYEIRIPTSISFASMDELKFDHFYHRAVAVCLTKFLPETTPAELEEYVSEIASFSG